MLLEDKLLMILEARQAGKSDEDISRSMGLEVQIINKYENYLKERINENRWLGVRKIANRIGVSPLIVNMAKEVYGLEIERLRLGIAKERIAQIEGYIQQGKSLIEISALLGLEVNTIRHYYYNFVRSKGSQAEKDEGKKVEGFSSKREWDDKKIEEILETAKWYVRTKDIALLTETNVDYIRLILCTLGTREERKVNVIKNALDEGVNSIDELCVRAGTKNWLYLKKFCEKHNLPFPETSQEISVCPRRPAYDELISEGVSSEEIGERLGVSGQCVRYYIRNTGRYEHYKELRKLKNLKAQKELYHQLSGLVKLILEKKAETEPWPIKKAVQWFLSLKQPAQSRPFEKVVRVFKNYETALNKGKKLSLAELSSGTGITHGMTIRGILLGGGEKPMYGSREKVSPEYRIEACLRGAKTKLFGSDIAHYLGLEANLPEHRFKNGGISKKQGEFLANLGSFNRVSFHVASQIYEAHDEGLKRNEIAELYGLKRKIVDYTIKHRKEFEKRIVNELRILFNDNKVKWPYVTPRMRKNLELKG